MTVEGLLFSKNGGGASITLGYRTKDDSTTSYVAAEHMVNKPGGTRALRSRSLFSLWSCLMSGWSTKVSEAALI